MTNCPTSIEPIANPRPPHTEGMSPDCAVEVLTTIEKYAGLSSVQLPSRQDPHLICLSAVNLNNTFGEKELTNACVPTDKKNPLAMTAARCWLFSIPMGTIGLFATLISNSKNSVVAIPAVRSITQTMGADHGLR